MLLSSSGFKIWKKINGRKYFFISKSMKNIKESKCGWVYDR